MHVGVIAEGLEVGENLLAGDPRRRRTGPNREIDRGLAGGPHARLDSFCVRPDEMTLV